MQELIEMNIGKSSKVNETKVNESKQEPEPANQIAGGK